MSILKIFYFFIICLFLVSCSNEHLIETDLLDKENLLKINRSNQFENDLYTVSYYQISNLSPLDFPELTVLNEGLLIEELTEETYILEKKLGYRQYLKDTLKLVKNKNIISLGKLRLRDKFFSNNRYEKYDYLGTFPTINQYLVQGSYLDSLDFKLIDINSGQIKYSFISFPIISKNGNFVAVAKTNNESGVTYFEIYTYADGFYKSAFRAIFPKWEIVAFEKYGFWGRDGSLYLKALMNNKELYLKFTLN